MGALRVEIQRDPLQAERQGSRGSIIDDRLHGRSKFTHAIESSRFFFRTAHVRSHKKSLRREIGKVRIDLRDARTPPHCDCKKDVAVIDSILAGCSSG